MAAIQFSHVSKAYADGQRAVADLNLEIADGEFLVLVGPSGCGKSTALSMIAGLEEITDGTLTIGERVANGLSPRQRNVAMIFQSYALYPHLSVARESSASRSRCAGSRRRHRGAGRRSRRRCSNSSRCSRGGPDNFPAASASVSRWAAR